jgi:hypothetical protein
MQWIICDIHLWGLAFVLLHPFSFLLKLVERHALRGFMRGMSTLYGGMKHTLCCNREFWLHYSQYSWPPPTSESSQKANIWLFGVWLVNVGAETGLPDVIQLLPLNKCAIIKISTDENITSGFQLKWRPLIFYTRLDNNVNVFRKKVKLHSKFDIFANKILKRRLKWTRALLEYENILLNVIKFRIWNSAACPFLNR